MKIWQFNHYAAPPHLHSITRSFHFAKYLHLAGHEPTIFAASSVHNSDMNLISSKEHIHFKKENIGGIDYVFVKTRQYKGNGLVRIYNMWQFYFGLYRAGKNFAPPDFILATSVHPLTCVAGIRLAEKWGCPCIVEIADLWPETLVQFGRISSKGLTARVLYALEQWIYKKADKVIFTFEGGKEYLRDKQWNLEQGGSVDLNKVEYINNGIDLQEFDYNQTHYTIEDEDLSNQQTFKVLYTGSLGEANEPRYIVEAAQILQRAYPQIVFIIYGTGAKKDHLQAFCREHDLHNVIFKGRVEKKYIPFILSQGQLNVITGKHIGLYKYGISLNKLFDYMASGKPTVSNMNCGYDNLEKYHCGLTVEGGNADFLAQGILHFYAMPSAEYSEYCSNARRAAKDFDFAKLTDRLIGLIKSLSNSEL